MSAHSEFQGSTALVTGASNGIGAETAFLLGEAGAFVMIHYNKARRTGRSLIVPPTGSRRRWGRSSGRSHRDAGMS